MLTIYGRDTSSNVQAVMWGAAELGLTVDRLDYGHQFGGLDTAEYRALNPHGRVPTLVDTTGGGNVVVWESCAILRYLAAQYGDGVDFWPSDPAQRSQVDKWAEWAKISITLGFTVPIFWSRVRTAASDRDEAALSRAIAAFEAQLDQVDAQLDRHSFLAGDAFTLADVILGHVLYRWFDIDVPRKPRPQLEAYYHRLCARPAYSTHVMVDYSVLRVPGA